MDKEEAIHRLLVHGSYIESELESGLLGSFRPYRGLRHDLLNDIVDCIRVLKDELHQPCVDTRLMLALWSICGTTKLWVLDKDSMVRRNKLISNEDLETLDNWLRVWSS